MLPHELKTKALRIACMFVTVVGLLIGTTVEASEGGPKCGAMNLSSSGDNDSSSLVFPASTPEIFLHVELIDMVGGETLTATWIAEKTETALPNARIDSSNVTTVASMNDAKFSLHKPDTGWPIGDYRVDMSINGKSASTAHFKVVQ